MPAELIRALGEVEVQLDVAAALSALAALTAALAALFHSRNVRRDLEDPSYPGKTPAATAADKPGAAGTTPSPPGHS